MNRCERRQFVRVAVPAASILGQGRGRLRDPTDQHTVLLRLRVPRQLWTIGHHTAHGQVKRTASDVYNWVSLRFRFPLAIVIFITCQSNLVYREFDRLFTGEYICTLKNRWMSKIVGMDLCANYPYFSSLHHPEGS